MSDLNFSLTPLAGFDGDSLIPLIPLMKVVEGWCSGNSQGITIWCLRPSDPWKITSSQDTKLLASNSLYFVSRCYLVELAKSIGEKEAQRAGTLFEQLQ